MSGAGVRVVVSTAASLDEAERMARHLVERRLAACVNVVPGVISVYRWEGQVERNPEVLLFIKTRVDLSERLREAVVAAHSYDVPEVLELDVIAGHPPYLEWVRATCEVPESD